MASSFLRYHKHTAQSHALLVDFFLSGTGMYKDMTERLICVVQHAAIIARGVQIVVSMSQLVSRELSITISVTRGVSKSAMEASTSSINLSSILLSASGVASAFSSCCVDMLVSSSTSTSPRKGSM